MHSVGEKLLFLYDFIFFRVPDHITEQGTLILDHRKGDTYALRCSLNFRCVSSQGIFKCRFYVPAWLTATLRSILCTTSMSQHDLDQIFLAHHSLRCTSARSGLQRTTGMSLIQDTVTQSQQLHLHLIANKAFFDGVQMSHYWCHSS